MAVNSDFRELFAALNATKAEYLVVGGYALAFHERPRFTSDLAIWVRAAPDNATRVADALAKFGVPPRELDETLLAQPDVHFKLGEGFGRIDILTGLLGLDFEEAWSERLEARYGGEPVGVISRRHLIAVKRAAGRPQDLLDAGALERLGPATGPPGSG